MGVNGRSSFNLENCSQRPLTPTYSASFTFGL
jgi:hypothetical protein